MENTHSITLIIIITIIKGNEYKEEKNIHKFENLSHKIYIHKDKQKEITLNGHLKITHRI